MVLLAIYDLAFLALSYQLVFRLTSNDRWMALATISSIGTLLNAVLIQEVTGAAMVVVVGMALLCVHSLCNYHEAKN